MKRLSWILGAAMCAAVAAHGDASAATVTVTYDLDASTLDITAPLEIPNAGDITGTAVITFTADDAGNIVDGPLTLDSMDLGIALSLAGIGVSGNLNSALASPAVSVLTGNTIGDAPVTFLLTGTINCAPGKTCALLGLPPVTDLDTSQDLTLANGQVNPLAAPSHLSGSQTLSLALGTLVVDATVTLSGAETGRVFVPEPGTVMLVGMGLAGLAALGRKRG